MPNLIATGTAWLTSQLKSHASDSITLSRSGETDVTLSASIGSSEFDTEDENGFLTKVESRDFIVDAADYAFAAGAVEPARGDQFRETVGSAVHVYEVFSFGSERQLFRYSDAARTRLRVHTKKVDVE